MTVLFSPDLCAPKDPAGWGRWLIGHYLEHQAMATAAMKLTPALFVKDFGLQQWSDEAGPIANWLNVHQQIHQALRYQSGLSGIDLSAVDLTKDEDFLDWQTDHRQEHVQLRGFYGL